jgi:Uma2 family endonuclease
MESEFLTAEELGIKLEIVNGLPIWEASPVILHQEAVDNIRNSIKKSSKTDAVCECVHYADIYVQFPDGSLKRPDISIFCEKPKEKEDAVKMIPAAVVEILSKKYEKKDLEIGVPFYLANGVKDVVVFNPYTEEVLHFRQDETLKFQSPVGIEFECGCHCVV